MLPSAAFTHLPGLGPLPVLTIWWSGEVGSAGRDQAIGLVRREVTGRGGLDVTLEVANRCPGPSPEDAVHRPFVITQATQRFLDLPPDGLCR
jgi:hypothetical protein